MGKSWLPVVFPALLVLAGCGETAGELPAALAPSRVGTPATPPARLGYARPGATLSYEFSSTTTMEVEFLPPPGASENEKKKSALGVEQSREMMGHGMRVLGRAELRPGAAPERMDLHVTELGVGMGGGVVTRRSSPVADVFLLPGERRVREVDGPTTIWSAFGTFRGLTLFFPDLPEGAGSTQAWELAVHGQACGAAVEVRRGGTKAPPGFKAPAPRPETLGATATFERWIAVDGEPAGVVRTRWTFGDPAVRPLPAPPAAPTLQVSAGSTGTGEGVHVILASGAVLYASIRETTDFEMRYPKGDVMKQHHVTTAELRLVGGPGTRMLPRPAAPLSLGERAKECVRAFRDAVAAGKPGAAVALLEPELVTRHGKGALEALLAEHVQRYGPASLGILELPGRTRHGKRVVHLEVTGNLARARASGNHRGVTLEVELVDAGPAMRIRQLRSRIGFEPVANVLEISIARLYSSARAPGGFLPED